MLESLYAKENARWKRRNISLNPQDFVSMLFRVQWSPGGRMAGESKNGLCDNHDQAIIICLHLLSLSSFTSWHGKWHSQPLSLKKPFLSSQTLPVLTEWGSEGGGEKSRQRHFLTRGFLLLLPFFFSLWSISALLVKTSRTAQLLGWLGELLGKGWNPSVGEKNKK